MAAGTHIARSLGGSGPIRLSAINFPTYFPSYPSYPKYPSYLDQVIGEEGSSDSQAILWGSVGAGVGVGALIAGVLLYIAFKPRPRSDGYMPVNTLDIL